MADTSTSAAADKICTALAQQREDDAERYRYENDAGGDGKQIYSYTYDDCMKHKVMPPAALRELN